MRRLHLTSRRIAKTALILFLESGIRKTSMDVVAARCGLARATIYLHYENKKALVRDSFMVMVDEIEKAIRNLDKQRSHDTITVARDMANAARALPKGDLPTALKELQTLYPDIFNEYQVRRLNTVRIINKRIMEAAKREGLILLSGDKIDLLNTIMSDYAVFVITHPLVLAQGSSFREIYLLLMDIFLWGVLRVHNKRMPPNLRG